MLRAIYWTCPYCGHLNTRLHDWQSTFRAPTLERCDVDEGGCDRMAVMSAQLEMKITSIVKKVEGEDDEGIAPAPRSILDVKGQLVKGETTIEVCDGCTIHTLNRGVSDRTWHVMVRDGGSVSVYYTSPQTAGHAVIFDTLDKVQPDQRALRVIEIAARNRVKTFDDRTMPYFDDWPNWSEHLLWLLTATVDDIKEWADSFEEPAEDREL